MKSVRLYISVLILSFQLPAFAAEVVGQGWGDTEAIAKREALSDISSRISITVRSKIRDSQTVNATTVNKQRTERISKISESTVETHSELPILGVTFSAHNEDGKVSVKAVLNSSKSLRLYENRLDELRSQLSVLNASVAKGKNSEAQYHAIMDMFTLLDEFKKLNTVAMYLDGKPQGPGVDESALQAQLRAATKQVDSLEIAAKLLTAGMDESGIYVYPAKAKNSNEITPFGALIKDKISANLKVALDPRVAQMTLTGEYEELADGIDLTYHLVDNAGLAQKTNSVHLGKKAYAGIETTPTTADFEKLLQAGIAVSGNLHAAISTHLGGHDLLFTEGDEVELFVKLSEMGYFYVLGHTDKASEKNSYLLEMSEAQGARKFIRFVNADDANKWISIGKFQVSAPFGVEGLQVFASNKDLIDSLPPANLDSATGLYLVADTPKEGVIKTRSLIKKFAKTAQTSETSLIFTTKAR